MTNSSKGGNSCQESGQNSHTNDKSKFLEEGEVAAEEESTTAKCCDAPAKDAHTHLSVGLSAFSNAHNPQINDWVNDQSWYDLGRRKIGLYP